MSYVRNDSLMYQMPVHFGPCVTPRQNKEGNRFIYDQATRLTKHTIVYEVIRRPCPLSCPSGSSWLPPTSSSI